MPSSYSTIYNLYFLIDHSQFTIDNLRLHNLESIIYSLSVTTYNLQF